MLTILSTIFVIALAATAGCAAGLYLALRMIPEPVSAQDRAR